MLPRIFLRHKVKFLCSFIFLIYLLNFFGAFTHYYEKDFKTTFNYPLEGDILPYVYQLRNSEIPEIPPINIYNYTFITNCQQKCMDDGKVEFPRLVFIVKSAMENFNRRVAIRNSWGYEKRFSDVIVRTIFTLGISDSVELQKLIDLEANNYNDIVQASFIDTYFNNTIKTMMGIQWVAKFCNRSRFYFFVDDDYYISTKNVLRFIRNPVFYPEYLEKTNEHLRKLARRRLYSSVEHNESDLPLISKQTDSVIIQNITDNAKIRKKRMLDMDLPIDIKLFAGFVFQSSPHRHKSSKFYISLNEYPWHLWPTYVTAGAYILSRESLLEMYYAAMYTKHFRFDDIFLGIVANKAHIEPLHSEEFYFYKASTVGHNYKYVIASHGYGNHEEMLRVWNSNKAAGYA